MMPSLYLIAFSVIMNFQGFNDRRILVISASASTPKVQNQIDLLMKNSLQLEERQIAVYTLIGGQLESILNSSDASETFLEHNKKDFTATSSHTLYLIGLDKGVKQTFNDVTQPERIFDIVDSMPMRRAEMRRH